MLKNDIKHFIKTSGGICFDCDGNILCTVGGVFIAIQVDGPQIEIERVKESGGVAFVARNIEDVKKNLNLILSV